MPRQCPLWKHVGASKDRIIVWPIQQWKPDCIRTEVSNLEILYQLLEQSEDLHHQWWSSSHDQAIEILWFSAYSSIVHDVLEKNVSTNLDNIIMYLLCCLWNCESAVEGGKLVLLINTDKKSKKQALQTKLYQKFSLWLLIAANKYLSAALQWGTQTESQWICEKAWAEQSAGIMW